MTESEIPICSEFAHATWDEEFMAELGPQSQLPCYSDEEAKGSVSAVIL